MLQSRSRGVDGRRGKRRQRGSRFHGGGRDWLDHGRGGFDGCGGLDGRGRCRDFGCNRRCGDSWRKGIRGRSGRLGGRGDGRFGDSGGIDRGSRRRRDSGGIDRGSRIGRDGRSHGRGVVGRFDFTTALGSRRHDTCRVHGNRVHLGSRGGDDLGRRGRGSRLLLGRLVVAPENGSKERPLRISA